MINNFMIDVRLCGDVWIIHDEVTFCYGVGATVLQALADYQDSLFCWQLDIAVYKGKLAPHLEIKKAKTAGWFRWRG